VKLLGKECSRHHAEIRRDGPLHIVKDLGSRNGIFVNGAKVPRKPDHARARFLRMGEWDRHRDPGCARRRRSRAGFDLPRGQSGMAGRFLRPILEQAKKGRVQRLPTVILGETGTEKRGWPTPCTSGVAERTFRCRELCHPRADLGGSRAVGYRKGAFQAPDAAEPWFLFFARPKGDTLPA